jgi:hypothetical protein
MLQSVSLNDADAEIISEAIRVKLPYSKSNCQNHPQQLIGSPLPLAGCKA